MWVHQSTFQEPFPRVPCILLTSLGCQGGQKAVNDEWRLPQLFLLQKMGCSFVFWKTLGVLETIKQSGWCLSL